MRKRRKQRNDEGGSERWMVTYADMITLLLIFFIVMYSMSEVEKSKFNSLVGSLKNAFQTETIEPSPDASEVGVDVSKSLLPAPEKIPAAHSENEHQLDKLYQKLQSYIKEHDLNRSMSLVNLPRGVQITFNDSILFDLGKAKLKKRAYPVLKDVGGLLQTVPNPISIEGHTDDQPIVYANQFASNWELSTSRSQSVRHYLQNKKGLKPARMRVVGYGEYKPKEKNDSKAHRAENRRVNIVILRQADETPKEKS